MMIDNGELSPFYQRQQDRQDAKDAAANAAAPAAVGIAQSAQPTPVDTPGPAPAPQQGQGGPPAPAPSPAPTPQAAPPAIASAVEGIEGSADTGGVKGTFQQAGTKGFAQKFGGDAPAAWFRNMGRGNTAPNPAMAKALAGDRGATTRGGQTAGGSIPSVSALPSGPEGGAVGGGPQDEEWQRFMKAVLASRFGGQ